MVEQDLGLGQVEVNLCFKPGTPGSAGGEPGRAGARVGETRTSTDYKKGRSGDLDGIYRNYRNAVACVRQFCVCCTVLYCTELILLALTISASYRMTENGFETDWPDLALPSDH